MKNKIKTLILLIFTITTFSCNREKAIIDDEGTINISVKPDYEEMIPVNNLIDSVHFIKLETTQNSLLSEIEKIFFIDDLLILHDKRSRSLFVFDKSGNFKYNISKIGTAPGEYIDLLHSFINEEKKQIIIYDDTSKKIIYYSYNGEFIKEITNFSNNAVIHDIINLNNGNFLCYYPIMNDELEYTGLWEVDSLGTPLKRIFELEIQYPIIYNSFSSYLYELPEGGIGFATADLYDIYHYQNDSLKKYMSYKVLQNSIEEFSNMEKAKENFTRRLNTYEKGQYIITEWIDKEYKPFITIYSKKTKQNKSAHWINFDIPEIPTLFGSLTNSNLSNVLVSLISSDVINDYLINKKTSDIAYKNLA